jgi:hypothetical protein
MPSSRTGQLEVSWVRYDDGFDSHPKVTLVVAEDPAAIALHLLANTWSSRQKRPGFVPLHQPGVLVGSKQKGARWAALLERAGLWDRVEDGWEFHDHAVYRASEKRQSAGTPSDLSEKRAAAGRRGGKAAQQRKQTSKQTVQQNEQGVEQTLSKPCSPVVASNEATPVPVPVPTTSGVASPTPAPITAHTDQASPAEPAPPTTGCARAARGARRPRTTSPRRSLKNGATATGLNRRAQDLVRRGVRRSRPHEPLPGRRRASREEGDRSWPRRRRRQRPRSNASPPRAAH